MCSNLLDVSDEGLCCVLGKPVECVDGKGAAAPAATLVDADHEIGSRVNPATVAA